MQPETKSLLGANLVRTPVKHMSAKVVFAGPTNVGKSSIICRYDYQEDPSIHNRFSFITPTIGAAFNRRKSEREGNPIYIDIWDTAGQERFRSLSSMYFRNCSYCILVFDLTDYNTFKDIKIWKSICDDACSIGPPPKRENFSINPTEQNTEFKPTYFLVGNKTDLKKRAITESEIKLYCDNNNITHYIETSAYNGDGVKELFDKLYDHIYINNTGTIPVPQINLQTTDTPSCYC